MARRAACASRSTPKDGHLAGKNQKLVVPGSARDPIFAVRLGHGDQLEFVRLGVYLAHGPPTSPYFSSPTKLLVTFWRRAVHHRARVLTDGSLLLDGSFTNEDGERSAPLHHDALAVDCLKAVDDAAAANGADVDGHAERWPTAWRHLASELSEVVGDLGTLRMEPLRVGGEPRGIRRTREASTSSAVATSSGVTADCPG